MFLCQLVRHNVYILGVEAGPSMMCIVPSLERFSLKENLSKSLFYPSLKSNGKRDFFFVYENHKTRVGDLLYSFNHLVTLQVNNLRLKFCIRGLKDSTLKAVEST